MTAARFTGRKIEVADEQVRVELEKHFLCRRRSIGDDHVMTKRPQPVGHQ
jgi:hypothetical protein